jgi:hypothetical protein
MTNSTAKTELKVYVQGHGIYGCLIVITHSEADAREKMMSEYTYDPNKELDAYGVEGFTYFNYGDA